MGIVTNTNINFASKISSGFSNEKFKIVNFSDRFFIKQNILLSIDNSITEIVRNFKPDLLLLGHTNSISIQTLFGSNHANTLPSSTGIGVGGCQSKFSSSIQEL